MNQAFKRFKIRFLFIAFFSMLIIASGCSNNEKGQITVQKGDHIVLIGNNLGSRMMNYGHFETEMHMRFSDSLLYIRNMCDGGNTAGFRPHSGRKSPWAFPNAEQFHDELANNSNSQGHFETPDEWLTRLKADIILGFFGYSESFMGEEGLENFKGEVSAFIEHTKAQKYNGISEAKLVLISPIAFQDLSENYDLPNGETENVNLKMYSAALRELAIQHQVPFVNAFESSQNWFKRGKQLTIDGAQLNEEGYQKFSTFLADDIFGASDSKKTKYKTDILEAVNEKNWFWHNDFKIPNGVHVFGRRYDPFGPDNYPAEIAKIREMTDLRDQAIWKASKGETMDLKLADESTSILPPVTSNVTNGYGIGQEQYLYGEEAEATLTAAPGYEIKLFASEKEFPDLANPVQLSFDNKGRLWVAVMPSYPHYKPGDDKPNDKLLILEDTDGDGKADKQTIFAEGLHLPIGFEFAPEGVYVSQGTNLVLISDTDGDDQADKTEILLSGFDDHDTHHAISAFCADPSGAIYMGEGVFLHTNVETAYGPVRGTNGGFYRYSPQRRHLERTAQMPIPNPWGIAFDKWGQNIFAETSGPAVRWMMPSSAKPIYGKSNHKSHDLVEEAHMVRPTSGLEFVSSRHFPDEVQGDLLINNCIGFLGTKQHAFLDKGTGYEMKHRLDLIESTDKNFRPVDMEFAPDGSLYVVDWHNTLIGHMQHNARDPLRDHVHGRIYRVTYPSRPLVVPAKIVDATINELLDNLKLPEYRTRYRTRRELRARNSDEVLKALKIWVAQLDKKDENYNHQILEGLWLTWGLNNIDKHLLDLALNSSDYRVRTAAVKVLRYSGHQVSNHAELLMKAAKDDFSRVRFEAMVAASWLDETIAKPIIKEVGKKALDEWTTGLYIDLLMRMGETEMGEPEETEEIVSAFRGKELERFKVGKEIYGRDGFCSTCHRENGKGLQASQFPPLAETEWVNGNPERLIKLTLKGLYGPIVVKGKTYPGQVPMTPFGGLLNDEEIASVLTYVRNSFGNEASAITPEQVAKVREETKDKRDFYHPKDLK